MSLTTDELVSLISREIDAFRVTYGVNPTYAHAAAGLGGDAPLLTVQGIPVGRTHTYGLGSPMGITVGISTHTDIARWGWTSTPPTVPGGCSGMASAPVFIRLDQPTHDQA